jgi:hypothetical protein
MAMGAGRGGRRRTGLGRGELVAGLLGGPSLIAAIGGIVIDLQPPGAKDFIVSIFGTNDKLALEVSHRDSPPS